MALQGKYFGPLNAMAQGKAPYNAQVVVRNAGYLQALSEMPWDGFTPDTKDRKKSRVAGGLDRYGAVEGSPGPLPGRGRQARGQRKAMRRRRKRRSVNVGKACGACHENFRAK